METPSYFDTQFSECMSAERSEIEAPPIGLLWKARNMVAERKNQKKNHSSLLDSVYLFIQVHLKTYPLGLTVLLICSGFFYFNEPNYTYSSASSAKGSDQLLSICNNTISVNSSTILTSIPTLVIRN